MSTYGSRQAVKIGKGNHRRTLDIGRGPAWGLGEDPSHSFDYEEALFYYD